MRAIFPHCPLPSFRPTLWVQVWQQRENKFSILCHVRWLLCARYQAGYLIPWTVDIFAHVSTKECCSFHHVQDTSGEGPPSGFTRRDLSNNSHFDRGRHWSKRNRMNEGNKSKCHKATSESTDLGTF